MRSSKRVMSKEAAETGALQYRPRPIDQDLSHEAEEFLRAQEGGENTFRMSDLVATRTGILEKVRKGQDESVEKRALEKVQEIQEQAFKEAHALGQKQGSDAAFKEEVAKIEAGLTSLNDLLVTISKLKLDMALKNESYLVDTVYFMAKKVALTEIEQKPQMVLEVIKKTIEMAQSDEQVTVKVSKEDHQFIKENVEKLGRDFEFLKKLKFETDESLKRGGCVVETQYGAVDASLEQRIEKLWNVLDDRKPKTPEEVKK